MAIYKYKAKKGPGGIIEGTLEAKTKEDVIENLSRRGLLPVSVEEGECRADSRPDSSLLKISGRIKPREVTVFTRQLASLLKSGIQIFNAINIITEQAGSPAIKKVLADINSGIKDGSRFSHALAKYPKVFSDLYISMVRAGENSGMLPEVLTRIAQYRRKQDELVSRIRMALAYPVIMSLVGCATVVFMLTFVMPRLTRVFTQMGRDLPMPTQIMIYISDGLRQWWFAIAIFIIAFILICKKQSKTESGQIFFSRLKLSAPVIKEFLLKAELARFCLTLELLIRNGITILEAIKTSIPVLGNRIIKDRLKESYKELEQGSSLGSSLKKSELFPVFMSNLISVGEESGRLDDSLAEIGDSYERDTDEAIKIMSNMLEPVIILVLGLIVGFIVVAMLLPVFEMNLAVR